MSDINRLSALEQAIIKITDMDLGVYPQSFVGKYEKRTEYMNGWNACVIKHTEALRDILAELKIHIDAYDVITIKSEVP